LNEGPAFRESLNLVAGRARFGGSWGSEDCGESMVVAKVREHGVRARWRVWKVDLEMRQRDRGIEAAIMKIICVQIEREE
jgi:hypothetical protein